jgi:hypothetical protein
MKVDASQGTFADLIVGYTPQVIAIAYKLRDIIAEVYPDVTEAARPEENYAAYAIGRSNRAEEFGCIYPRSTYVRLGFYFGEELPDPYGLLSRAAKYLHHMRISTLAEVERPEVRQLVAAAVKERQAAMGKP